MSAANWFQFGRHVVSARQVFLQTHLSFAFTNRKPVLPGHVLVATRRVVPRFSDLTVEEVGDLFQCAHTIAPILQRAFNSTSLTISVQDGKDAGQTVEHVHVHIMPRRPGDFRDNDDIYKVLEEHDSKLAESGKEGFRSEDEMAAEADQLSPLFKT